MRRSPDTESDKVFANLYRLQVLELPDYAVFLVDVGGNVTTWNRGVESVFGYTSKEFVGQPFSLIFTDKDRANREHEKELERARECGRSADVRWHRRKDGTTLYVDGVIHALRSEDGTLLGYSKILKDATARWRAEQERDHLLGRLEEDRARLESVLQQMPAGMLMAEAPSGRIIMANRQAAELMGRPMPANGGDDESYQHWRAFRLDGTPLEPEEYPLARTLRTGQTIHGEEFLIERGDGTLCIFSLNAAPIRDSEGKITAAVITFRDITRRKEAERALHRSEERFRTAFLNAPIGMVLCDLDGRLLQVNRAYCDITGYCEAELLGRTFASLTHPDDVRENLDNYRDMVEQRRLSYALEKRYLKKNGDVAWVRATASVLYDDVGEPQKVVGMVEDITLRKQTEEHLRQTQKLESIGVLAGGIAHDFNNLLTGILGNASLALEAMREADPAREMLEQVVQASEKAGDLIRQMLAYSGKGRFVVEPLNMSELVQNVTALLRSSIPRTVDLRLHLDEDLPAVAADRAQIQQVVMNLVMNAGEAVGEEGTGEVEVKMSAERVNGEYTQSRNRADVELAPGEYVRLAVRDNGSGMDAQTAARMFDPFFTTKFLGRGLGLSAVLGIVRTHKGSIEVESAPGRGTTVTVLLPATEKAARQEPDRAVTVGHAGGTVLVIDDEKLVRDVAKTTLERRGYRVLVAENGRDGIQMLELRQDVCAVLLDLTMPVMSGEETLKRIKEIRPELPVILSSGFSEDEAMRRFRGEDIAGFVQKPFTPGGLAAKFGDLGVRS